MAGLKGGLRGRVVDVEEELLATGIDIAVANAHFRLNGVG
jgi:hypothetical protein